MSPEQIADARLELADRILKALANGDCPDAKFWAHELGLVKYVGRGPEVVVVEPVVK